MAVHKAIEFQIKGMSPVMMHNGRLANPMDPFSKAIKEITGKRKKTNDDYEAIALLEWEGSLYLDDKGRPCFPGEVIEAMLATAAKKNKLGKKAKAAILSDGNWALEYDGPKTVEKLKQDPAFRDLRGVRVSSARVMRCRPIFHSWALTFVVHYLPDMLNQTDVEAMVTDAGRGESGAALGDGRPRYGRYEIVKVTPLKDAKVA